MCMVASHLHLRCKSDPKIEETQHEARATPIEDGARPRILEQAVALNLDEVKVGEFDMLKHVRQLVGDYKAEGARCGSGRGSLEGLCSFPFLHEHRRGRLHIDTNNRPLTIEMLP
jgi:hypothetical protein